MKSLVAGSVLSLVVSLLFLNSSRVEANELSMLGMAQHCEEACEAPAMPDGEQDPNVPAGYEYIGSEVINGITWCIYQHPITLHEIRVQCSGNH